MNYRPSPFAGLPPVTKNLLIINGLFFLATIAMKNALGIDLVDYLGMHMPMSERFLPHQIISYMFMHGDFGHVFFNMFAVFMFGRTLEAQWGPKRFLTFYVVTGVGAAIIQVIVNYITILVIESKLSPEQIQTVYTEGMGVLNRGMNYTNSLMGQLNLSINTATIGASGAVFGILMGFGMLFPDARLMLLFPPIPIKGKYIAILALVMGIWLDYRGNVAHFAHLGGMIFAFFMIRYWRKKGNY